MNKQAYFLIDRHRQKNAIQFIQSLPVNPDSPLVVTIQERTRTLDQNARLWAMLNDISEQVVWHGLTLSSEDWKHIFTASLKGQRSAPGLEGGFVILGQSTSRMTVGELRDLIELINAFGATHGVKFSDESRLAIEWANRFGDKGKVAA
ncbi:recombination protein NinB [Yersinia enterocolitica]